MKRALFCSMVVFSVEAQAMCLPMQLTEQEKIECSACLSNLGLKSVQDYGSQLRIGIKDDRFFLEALRNFAKAFSEASTSIISLRKNEVKCSPKVRQIMYRDIASSLASFGELFSQKKMTQRIQRVADENLISTLKQIGLLR